MDNLERCQWKLVPSDKFVLGQDAERCGEVAAVRILRPNRKTDLPLCEHHINEYVEIWGLHYKVKLLFPDWGGELV